MQLTAQQALNEYNAAYDNEAYKLVQTEVIALIGAGHLPSGDDIVQQTPEYGEIMNRIIDVSQAECGYPHPPNVAWELAKRLHDIAAPKLEAGYLTRDDLFGFFITLDGYLSIYRRHMAARREHLNADPHAKAMAEIQTAWSVAGDAMRTASDVPNWNGRAGYHLATAAEGILRTAMLMLAQEEPPSPSRFNYAGHKLAHALEALTFALSEIWPHISGKSLFYHAHKILSQFVEEVH